MDPLSHTQEEEVNAVYIFGTDVYDCDPLRSRDLMRQYLDGYILATDDERRLLDSELPDVLNTTHYTKVCSFFDRDQRVFNWHYTMYAREHSQEPINPIASIVSGGKVVRGPAVIVKDCPANLWAQLSTEVDVERVTATLWWYLKSGTVAADEFGERTLIRLLAAEAM